MKSTKLMLAFIFTSLSTWLGISFIGYLLCSVPFKIILTDPAIIILMIIVGWVPGVIVCADLDEEID